MELLAVNLNDECRLLGQMGTGAYPSQQTIFVNNA